MKFIEEIFKGTNDYIEIREIDREGEARQHFIKQDDIKDYNPPLDKNVYYGVYSRQKKDGKAKSCNTTKVLWVDYDDMADMTPGQRVEEVKERIRGANIPEPSIIVNSGNGVHAYWLLDSRAGDGALLVIKEIAKVTNGDIRATDKARIMRLPNTLNVKGEPIRCEIVQAYYNKVYNLEEIGDLLGLKVEKPQSETKEIGSLNIAADRPCINGMLKGVPEGERNFALGRITKWLQIKGYTQNQAKGIIIKWNKLNSPPEGEKKLLNDFYLYWKEEYKLLGCSLKNPELQQILYKYCNRPDCSFTMAIGNIELDNTVRYNNRLLNQLYDLSGNDLIIYGLLMRHKEGLITSLLIEKLTSRATKKECMSKPTRINCLDTLRKKGFIEVIEGNKREGKENLYKAIPQGTYGLGYTLITNGAVNGAIDKRVTAGEFKLYILLLKYAFGKGSCYPSLETMAKDIRTTPNNISMLLSRLEKADYIKRVYKAFNGVEKLDIRLLV